MTSPAPTFPQHTDTVLVGYSDPLMTELVAISNNADANSFLIADHNEGAATAEDPNAYFTYYCTYLSNGTQRVMVHRATERAERQQFIRDNAAAWLS